MLIRRAVTGHSRSRQALEPVDLCRSSVSEMAQAALTSPMWLKAWGKLPKSSPLTGSTSSASRPTSLTKAAARSKTVRARRWLPGQGWTSRTGNVPSSPRALGDERYSPRIGERSRSCPAPRSSAGRFHRAAAGGSARAACPRRTHVHGPSLEVRLPGHQRALADPSRSARNVKELLAVRGSGLAARVVL